MSNYRYAMSRRGMVASAHSLITSTGIDILRNEGTAMDAAVAMALTASVVLPDMCGIGGDTFMLYYDAKTKGVYALNGSGPMGQNYTIDFYRSRGYTINPEHGPLSIAVPGSISALNEGLKRFGHKSFAECSNDAIHHAREGFSIGKKTSEYIEKRIEFIKESKVLSEIFLNEDGSSKKVHTLVKNVRLARTLELLGRSSSDYFYTNLAQNMISNLNAQGASFIPSDFADYRAEWLEPIRVQYRNHWVYQTPPVSQGVIHLEMLNILKNFDLEAMGLGSSDLIHTMVEAKKLAFQDRIECFGDPKFHRNPIDKMLSEEYGQTLSNKIKPTESIIVKDFDHQSNHTTSLVVVDQEGNACSLITSISDAFGSGIMDDDTGILWNNRIGTNANMVDGHPNRIEPLKRTMNTLNTYMILDQDNNCRFVGNTPGGDNQPQWNAQTVVNLIDFKQTVLDAIQQPYWYDAQTSNPMNRKTENILHLERTADQRIFDELTSKGHVLKSIERCNGAFQLIEIKEDGTRCGASDFRAEGTAIGY